jgi:hypothetical protein
MVAVDATFKPVLAVSSSESDRVSAVQVRKLKLAFPLMMLRRIVLGEGDSTADPETLPLTTTVTSRCSVVFKLFTESCAWTSMERRSPAVADVGTDLKENLVTAPIKSKPEISPS